jgi:hypothetical protein
MRGFEIGRSTVEMTGQETGSMKKRQRQVERL